MADPKQDQNKPQGQPLAVKEVRLDQVGRDGKTLKGRVTGKAARGDKPAEGVNLILLVGGVQTPNSPLQTNGDGDASDDFAVPMEPEINRVLIEARVETGWPVARRLVDIPTASSGSKSKAVDKVDVVATGDKSGNWTVSVAVSAEDKTPLDGIEVIFLYNGEEHPETTKKGHASHKIPVTGKFCEVDVQVPAGGQTKSLRLLGPKERVVIPRLFSGIRDAWRQAAEDSRRENERRN